MTGRGAWRRGVALLAATAAAVALGGWWWQAAEPEATAVPLRSPLVGWRAAAPEEPAVPLRHPLDRWPAVAAPAVPDGVAAPEELRRWRRTIDEVLPPGKLPRAAWGRNHVRPRPSTADVRIDWQIDPGRHLLELACVGRGALELEVDLGATALRQAIDCTERGERYSVSGLFFDGRFAVRASAGPEAEGYLGYRLTAHAVVERLWGERATAALPAPGDGRAVAGGDLVAAGFAVYERNPAVGAGSYRITIVCVGRGEVLVSTPADTTLPDSVGGARVGCRERPPYPRTEGSLALGPGGLEISVYAPAGETLGWFRYLVTPA